MVEVATPATKSGYSSPADVAAFLVATPIYRSIPSVGSLAARAKAGVPFCQSTYS